MPGPNNPDDAKRQQPEVPSRAASLQRMLELERKQKMERVRQIMTGTNSGQPSERHRAHSRQAQAHHRRTASSMPPKVVLPESHNRSNTLATLSVNIPTTQISIAHGPAKEIMIKDHERHFAPPKEDKKEHEPSPLAKTVTFSQPDDGEQSDHSSICHSPTWDGYGQKKKKKKEEAEQHRKEKEREAKDAKVTEKKKTHRLTKEPPHPLDLRPAANIRASSAPILDSKHATADTKRPRHISELMRDGQADTAESLPKPGHVETVQTIARSPGFIGGVRLEREREAAMRRLAEARGSSDHPAHELTQPGKTSQSATPDATSSSASLPSKKRDNAAPVSYPPTASKSHILNQISGESGHRRSRSGSFLSGAARFLNPRSQDMKSLHKAMPMSKNHGSKESVHTVGTTDSADRSPHERGRRFTNPFGSKSRAQSYDSHERSAKASMDDKRTFHLPPLANTWSSKTPQGRTTSMIAVPPDSARDASFASIHPHDNNPQNDFSFLEQPFSPTSIQPLSPPGSLPASMKAKASPKMMPVTGSPRAVPHPAKKGFRDTLKAGFKASLNPAPASRRTQSDSNVTLDPSALPANAHPLQSHPISKLVSPKLKPSEEGGSSTEKKQPNKAAQPQQNQKGHGGSGASSSSSHPDSDSSPPSPLTTPESSRPQSQKGIPNLRLDDPRRTPVFSDMSDDDKATRLSSVAVLTDHSSSNSSSQTNTRPSSKEGPKTSQNKLDKVDKGKGPRKENAIDLAPPSSKTWSRSALPLDTDQLSFTSALTTLDLKPSIAELSKTLSKAVATEIEPLSLDPAPKDAGQRRKDETHNLRRRPSFSDTSSTTGLPEGSDTSFLPPLRHQAFPSPRSPARSCLSPLPLERKVIVDSKSQLPSIRTATPDSFIHSPNAASASAYLQEARRTMSPSSPLMPKNMSSGNTSSASLPNPLGSPRTFPLSSQKSLAPTASHLSLDTTGLKPIAKMFVECCHCKFFHDMPSAVYEAMARPDDVVKDKRLGVFGAVTTCVKCPWCAHNMSTQCCAGYAAVVYLREKLHGP